MYIKARIKKAAAIAAAFIITLSVMGGAANKGVDLVSATPDEYKARLAKLDEKQEELDKKINAKAEDIEAQVEKLDAINEQISTVEEKIALVESNIKQTEDEMVELAGELYATKHEIEVKETEIKDGVDDFCGRLRAMYVAGTESYTDMIMNSTDFYDVLMRLELIKSYSSFKIIVFRFCVFFIKLIVIDKPKIYFKIFKLVFI